MGDGFYRSEDPTNSIEVLKEQWHFQIISGKSFTAKRFYGHIQLTNYTFGHMHTMKYLELYQVLKLQVQVRVQVQVPTSQVQVQLQVHGFRCKYWSHL